MGVVWFHCAVCGRVSVPNQGDIEPVDDQGWTRLVLKYLTAHEITHHLDLLAVAS